MVWYSPDFANRTPTGPDLHDTRRNAGLTLHAAAELCGYTPRQWHTLETRPAVPLAPYRLVMAWSGWLPDPAWSGWAVKSGRLWTPENEALQPGHIRALPFLLEGLRSRNLRDPSSTWTLTSFPPAIAAEKTPAARRPAAF